MLHPLSQELRAAAGLDLVELVRRVYKVAGRVKDQGVTEETTQREAGAFLLPVEQAQPEVFQSPALFRRCELV